MADHRLALLTVVWWAGMVAVSPSNVFPLDACPAGDIANSADGLHCSGLPLEFVTDGVYHMRQSDSSVVKVYCDMTGGRWNEILRRGADAEKTLIAAANQLSFAGEAAGVAASPDRYKGFYGNISSEFFVGTDQLQEFGVGGSGSAYHSELLVELKTVELEYYFSIFNIDSINPLVFGKFIMGTAGNGNMTLLKDSSFSTACSEAWFIGTNCEDLEQVDRPNLMRPLDGTARAGGAYDWPGLEKQLQRISMKVRVNHGRFCTTGVKPELALSPIKMAEFNVDMTPAITTPEVAGKSAMATNITITCKDASKVIITKGQYEQNDYTGISGTKTFNCQRNSPPTAAAYDDLPLSLSAICMTPCKSGYTLVAPTTWTTNIADGTSHSIDRLSCLSPLQGTAGHGPYKAAEQCGTAGEQLLDFPVPKDRLVDIPDGVGLITAMHYSVNSANDNKFMIRDLRGSYFESHQFITTAGGNYKDSDRCVGLFVDDSVEHGTVTRQTACYNETLRFVCMSDVGCAPDQILLNGFCYAKLEAKVKDHEKTCYPDPTKDGGRNGMPAVPSAPLLETLASKPETIATPMAVGAYRRGDGFFQMDDAIPDGVITEVGDANDTRCAVLDKATKQLSAIACNDGDARLVICQYPGLPQEECPTIIKEKYPSATKVDTINPNSIKQVSTITAKNGFNYYEREGLHSLQYKCEGLRDDWKLETKLDSLANPAVSPWDPPQVMACTTDDKSGYPANSNFSVVDKYLIHRCIRPLQTSGSETEQQQTCNHVTPYMFTGGVTDCNECMMDPFSIPPSLPMSSSWDGQSRKLGHQVNYTCTLGLTTSNGTSVQQQTCTLSGWEGEVAPCDTCEWLDSFNSSSMDTSITGGLYFGGMVEMTCLPGLEAADGSVNSSAVCTPDVWNVCHDNFTCDHCHGPPLNHSEVAFVASYDWDGTSRQQNTVVTYTCEGTTVTETGLQLQYQNCTELGWTGEILPCGVCPNEPVNVTEEEATTKVWNGSQTFAAEAWYHCNNGTSTALGNTSQSQTCGTQGWFGLVLPCDSCVGQPINVTGMTAIVSDFSGENTIGAQVTYTCRGPLTTAAGQLSQTLNCTQHGWHGDVLPCEVCPPPPSGNHSTIRAVETSRNDGDRLGSSVTYRCNKNLYTEDGHSEIVAVCENDGWSVCEPEIRCNYCPDLGDVAKYRGTLSWDYEDVRELDTVVTLMCEDGLATPDLKTKQTLTCGLNGWNQAVPCSICTDPAPTPPLSMIPNVTWTVGDATAIYTCTDTKQLPWGLTKFEMTCSPSGWPCAPPCDHCAPLSSPLPPGVAAAAPEDVFNNHGGQASYDCNANLQTAMNQTTQALTCSEDGWEGELLPCDECVGDVTAPSPGQDRTWSGNTTIGTSVIYECLPGKETQENATYQTRNCTAELGWTPPPIPCDLCVPPRDPFLGMTREWDGNRTVNSTVTYSCDGNMTTMANETVQIITCTDDGWSAHVQPCALCRSPIPEAGFSEAGNYTIRNVTSWQDWRLQGAIIEYTCYTGLVQTATCDAGDWEPEELPPCVKPTAAPTDEVTMVTKASYDDKYTTTTNYHWADIDVNMTSTHGDHTWKTGDGPAGFENSLVLNAGCMAHQKWADRRDTCAENPADCEHGFSFSMWASIEMEDIERVFNGTVSTNKRYVLSTGGDDEGSPGIAIYVQGHELHALVSTGAEYWDVFIAGQIISQQWLNIGVRWSKTEAFSVPGSTTKLPGLQLYINSSPMARVASPSPAKAAVKEALSPVEVMVGCHRTAADAAYRDFCYGEFDELAMWTRLLPANESFYFLGGYDEQDSKTTMTSLLDEFKRCPSCRTDAKMFRAAIDRMQKAMKTKTPPPTSAPVGSTAAASAAGTADNTASEEAIDLPDGTPIASPESMGKVVALVNLVKVMTSDAKNPVTQEELPLFLSLHSVVGASLDKATLVEWRNIEYTYKEEGGAASVVTGFETWALKLGSNTEMASLKDNLIKTEKSDNIEMVLQKTFVFQLRQKPILSYPIGKTGLNTVQFASELFHNPDVPECRFIEVSVLFVFYSTLGHVSPQRYSKLDVNVPTSELELEGGIVSTKFELSADNPALVANCTPTAEKLRKYPLQASLSHTSPSKAKRGVLFHEDEINTGILRRACVWWNPVLSDYGGWDTDGCKAVDHSDFHTKCACAHFGQIAIMVQKDPPKIVDLEFMWLKIIKYICYTISALLLITFIVTVIKIKGLHEMFHLMRLNTAIGLLFGSVLMVLTDIPEIRADRHTCTGFAGAIHFFYLLAATMVMQEGIADFISVTSGAIGGKLKSYVAFAWGVPFLSLGYAMLMHLPDYGTDPRCMLGWPDQVKMTMFLPMIVLLSFTFVMTCLVSCNMQASRLRKENIVAEQLTVCKGFVFFSFYFFCTWIVGLIAYLRLGLSMPSFYPLFQILNSTGGIIFFLFCGIGSERFRLLIAGKSELRKKMLFSYTVSEQLSESQQNLVEKEPSRPSTPEDDQEEFDPEALGPRGPIVA